MKNSSIWTCFAIIFSLAVPCVRADVTLGVATFDASSDEVAEAWYEPMTAGSTKTFEGFGTNEGHTRTISYSAGGEVAGVKTVKRHLVQEGTPAATEDTWIAFDGEDNARILKIERAGAVVFEATAEATPPLYLPAVPQEGQSWEVAGTTVTLEQVTASRSGYKLKVTSQNAAGVRSTDYISAGMGLMLTESGQDSGWKPKP